MRVTSIIADNFASYKHVELDLENHGLTLIQGATGSGKSTLCDLMPWALFGITSKGGPVSEVTSWNTPDNDMTEVLACIEVQGKAVYIKRTRGNRSKDNDLCYFYDIDNQIRGKDRNDTQKLINNLLSLTPELYLAGAYFHEFTQTAQFFTTTAKNRRTICEQIVDLSLAKTLTDKISAEAKQQRIILVDYQNRIAKLKTEIEVTDRYAKQEEVKNQQWDSKKSFQLAQLLTAYESFESDKAQAIKTYEEASAAFLARPPARDICSECGTKLKAQHNHRPHNPFIDKIESVKARENTYLQQMETLSNQENPHATTIVELAITSSRLSTKLTKLETEISLTTTTLQDLETLQDCVLALRATTITQAISNIEHQTNQILTDYFVGECQVNFTVEDADKLEVLITKDGNDCSYTQLSKGQRQMLKLAFGISVMRQAANNSGVGFSQVWFDEALEGADENVKMKALRLFEQLSTEYESVFLVDHSESIKASVTNRINVQLIDGHSEITEN